ncbi:MAG: hypothetical protein ACRYGK_11850 [Janthinobacterium lividum]
MNHTQTISEPDLMQEHEPGDTEESTAPVQEPRLWSGDGWTARVIKNDDDEGWAVAMSKDGEAEPALIGPWTMGRDKKNPKPLDAPAFHTLVKTASEFVRRHEQQLEATLHKKLKLMTETGQQTILLDIVPQDDDPYATLTALDEDGEQLAKVTVAASFKLTPASAQAWVEGGYRKVG